MISLCHESRHASSCHTSYSLRLGPLIIKRVYCKVARHPNTVEHRPATRSSKDILILDCPFAALDVITAQTVMEGMLRLTSDKCTLLCTMSSSLVADIWEGFLGKNCDLHPRFHQNSWPLLKSGVSEIFTVYCCAQNSFKKQKVKYYGKYSKIFV